jgi:general secretion pathway protein I
LSRGGKSSTDRHCAGFAIIEALVALAVVTVSLAAIGTLMASTGRGTRQLENRVALVQAANNILWRDLPVRSAAVAPALYGRTMDHDWHMQVQPLANAGAATLGESKWIPAKIRIEVQSPAGPIVSLETVRLLQWKPPQ